MTRGLKFPKPQHKNEKGAEKYLDERGVRKLLIDIADDEFSLYIRERDGYKCMIAPHGCRCKGPMQCNHLISRSNYRLRWDERNAVCGCSGHNAWAHHNPVEWSELWHKIFPKQVTYLELARHGRGDVSAGGLRIIIKLWREKRAALLKGIH